MKALHLTLHRKWFDAIASGKKLEEYRDQTPYWQRRIEGHKHTEIHFCNGYRKEAPFMRVEYKGWHKTVLEGRPVYALALGKVLEIRNYPCRNAGAFPQMVVARCGSVSHLDGLLPKFDTN